MVTHYVTMASHVSSCMIAEVTMFQAVLLLGSWYCDTILYKRRDNIVETT